MSTSFEMPRLRTLARHAFPNGHMLFASYMRSNSRSNQVLDFNIDNPQFSRQQPGPYPWDSPNRFLSWGLLPIYKGFDFAYSTELRTGFPFHVVNDQIQLVEPPGSRRFPGSPFVVLAERELVPVRQHSRRR